MSHENAITDHYFHGDLRGAIEESLPKIGKTKSTVTTEDLASVDEFHIGGRVATQNLLEQLEISEDDHVLDIGCGLGGAARYVAESYGSFVTGIDLSQEYVDTGNVLCSWVDLAGRVTLQQGDVLSMPFNDEVFTVAYMLHVGMNVENKTQLFREVHRVLKPGTRFGIYDVMSTDGSDVTYPVPWASDSSTNHLATVDQYRNALADAGFEVAGENVRREFALEFFTAMRARMQANGGPPALGLPTLLKENVSAKITNMIDSISAGGVAPVEIIASKR